MLINLKGELSKWFHHKAGFVDHAEVEFGTLEKCVLALDYVSYYEVVILNKSVQLLNSFEIRATVTVLFDFWFLYETG